MRLSRVRSTVRREESTFATPSGRLHLGVLAVSLVALVLLPSVTDSILPACLGAVIALECAMVSSRRGGGNAGALLRLRAESFTVSAARLIARVTAMCVAACVVTFLLPLVVLVVSPPQRDVAFLFPVLVLAIMTARVAYLRVARWRAGHRPASGAVDRSLAAAAALYEESCRILIPANARIHQLRVRVHPGRLLVLLVRAMLAVALIAVAVLLAVAFFAIPALLPEGVSEEDLAAVTAQRSIVFPVTALVGVVLIDALQWLREWETDHELAATVHVVAVALAVAVLGDQFDDILSWTSSAAQDLSGLRETVASAAVGTVFGLLGALFVDLASSVLSSVVFLTRPHRGLTRSESLFGEEWEPVRAP